MAVEPRTNSVPVEEVSLTLWQVGQAMRTLTIKLASGGRLGPASVKEAGPLPLEQIDLFLVMVRVARLAIAGSVLELLGIQGVQDGRVALGAIDLVLGDVLVVHELVIADLRQVALAVVAGLAAFAGHVAVAADQVGVAALAVDALLEGQLVREFHAAAQVELLPGESGGNACRR